jgi:hypothetical protein
MRCKGRQAPFLRSAVAGRWCGTPLGAARGDPVVCGPADDSPAAGTMGNCGAPAGVEPNSTLAMAETSQGPASRQTPIAKKRNERKIKLSLLMEGTEKPPGVGDCSERAAPRMRRNPIAFMLADDQPRRNQIPGNDGQTSTGAPPRTRQLVYIFPSFAAPRTIHRRSITP